MLPVVLLTCTSVYSRGRLREHPFPPSPPWGPAGGQHDCRLCAPTRLRAHVKLSAKDTGALSPYYMLPTTCTNWQHLLCKIFTTTAACRRIKHQMIHTGIHRNQASQNEAAPATFQYNTHCCDAAVVLAAGTTGSWDVQQPVTNEPAVVGPTPLVICTAIIDSYDTCMVPGGR